MDGHGYESITYSNGKHQGLFEFPGDLQGHDSIWLDGTLALCLSPRWAYALTVSSSMHGLFRVAWLTWAFTWI